MALSDHLRELRARVLKVAVILTVGLIVSLFFFDQIFELVLVPTRTPRRRSARRDVEHHRPPSPAPAGR